MSAAPSGALVHAKSSDQAAEHYSRILLASEGREIPDAAIRRVLELLYPTGERAVRVLSIARVHGVAFGLPNPGLLPTKREWDEQREIVRVAVTRLRRKGVDVDGHVVGTRNPTKRILSEATLEECEAIVMAADPDKPRLIANTMWTQEPQRVRRRAEIPVYLVHGG